MALEKDTSARADKAEVNTLLKLLSETGDDDTPPSKKQKISVRSSRLDEEMEVSTGPGLDEG